jgi:hypothetical protein
MDFYFRLLRAFQLFMLGILRQENLSKLAIFFYAFYLLNSDHEI